MGIMHRCIGASDRASVHRRKNASRARPGSFAALRRSATSPVQEDTRVVCRRRSAGSELALSEAKG